MVLISWEDIGANSTQLAGRVGHAIRRSLCQFRQNNPFLFDPISTTFPSTPLAAFNRGFWNEVCSLDPIPGAYPQNVSGGQCNVQYRWFVDFSSPSVEGTRSDPFNATYLGAIRNPRLIFTRINNDRQVRMDFQFQTVTGTTHTFFVVNGDLDKMPFARAVRFVRVDGQPDNCGTIPVTRNVVRPINNTFNTTVNIDGTDITFPVTLGDIQISNNDVISFNPTLQTSLGDFSIELGGINIELVPDVVINPSTGGSSTDLQPVLNRIDESTLQLSTEISEVITEISDLGTLITGEFADLENLIRCCCCDENVTFQSQIIVSDTFGGTFELPDKTVALSIVVSGDITPGTKKQFGSGTAPNVFYWGWYAIGSDANNPGDRRELHYSNQAVFVPEFAKSITVNPIYNNRCTVIAVIRQPCGTVVE